MKKIFLLGSLFLCSLLATSQGMYTGKSDSTHIQFFSETPFENIEAVSNKAVVALQSKTSDILINIPIRNFKFKNALMEEHFNEHYLESDKYPTCSFRGKIVESVDYTKNGTLAVNCKGSLTLLTCPALKGSF